MSSNAVMYFEIQVDDPSRASKFYTDIFGWEFFTEPNSPVEYWQIKTTGINGGLFKRPAKAAEQGTSANAFVCSMMVEDFDVMSEKILKNGGQVVMPKFAIPGKCWQGYFLDTEGNTFGLFQVDETAR